MSVLMPSIFSVFGKGLKVDREKRIIFGFAVATAGPALGHDENLDQTTLDQIVEIGNKLPVRCRIDHPDQPNDKRVEIGNKLEKLVGFARNFRKDGDVVRADCYVLPADAAPFGDRLLALAESDAADFFGASMVHLSRTEKKNIRLEQLLAVDFVDFPAANPTGLFSVGKGGSTMPDPLKRYEREGKCYVIVEGKEYEVEMAPKKDAPPETKEEAEGDPEVKKDDEGTEAGAMSAGSAEKIRSDAIKKEREYRTAFNTALTAGGITGKEAEEFEKDFYGLDLKQVKFLAARSIAARAKPVGEAAGAPDPKEKEKAEEKALEEACVKRFEEEPQLVKLWSRDANPESDEYKAGFKRYLIQEKKWVKDQKSQAKVKVG